MRVLLATALSLVLFAGSLEGQAQACLDINTASTAELQRIRHIGPERAAQIVRLREQRRFQSVDQLTRVSGIAAGRLRDIKQQGLACVRAPSDSYHYFENGAGYRDSVVAVNRVPFADAGALK
jgi:competence ComEA-like helix-hairpin-helix protein